MTREDAFANLRDILADLYPDGASTRRIVDDSGLNDANIDFTGSTTDTWHAILRKAENTNKLDALFRVVTKADEYGGNQKLIHVIDAYRRQVIQEQAVPRVQNDSSNPILRSPELSLHMSLTNAVLLIILRILRFSFTRTLFPFSTGVYDGNHRLSFAARNCR